MHTYRIEHDELAGNPRDEFDNISTFYAVKNPRYLTGGKNDIEYTYRDGLEKEIKALKRDGAVIVEFTSDSGDCYAVVTRDQIEKEYTPHGYTMRKALYWARKAAQGEIETWLHWANGEVYGYIVENEEGENVDSCWGFYGYEYAKEAAQEAVKYLDEQEEQEQVALEKRLASI